MITQNLRQAAQLKVLLDSKKRYYGDRWNQESAPWRARIKEIMAQNKTDNALSAGITLSKQVFDSSMALAVATEMCLGNGCSQRVNHDRD